MNSLSCLYSLFLPLPVTSSPLQNMNEAAARQSMKPRESSQAQDLLTMFNETSAANTQSHLRLKTEARKKHGELNDLIDHLSDKLSDVASSIDKEFLAAYKGMYPPS